MFKNRLIILILLLTILFVGSFSFIALAAESEDQSNTTAGVGIGFGDTSNGRDYTCQGFIPTLDNITAVSIALNSVGTQGLYIWIDTADSNSFPDNGVGGIGGGTKIANGSLSTGLTKYTLDSSVNLTPSSQYVVCAAPWNIGSDIWASDYRDWDSSTANPYSSGKVTNLDGSYANPTNPDSGNADRHFKTWGVLDSCDPDAEGDWYIDASDNCVVSTDTYVQGNVELNASNGPGSLSIVGGANLFIQYGNISSTSTPIFAAAGTSIQTWKPNLGWYDSNYTRRKKITIQNSQVSGTSDLLNFPVLISLADSDLSSSAQADGDDIIFTSADGQTLLDYDLDVYSSGSLTAWVRIPELKYGINTVIYMYYGNSGASSLEDTDGTWVSAYQTVYHFSEDFSTSELLDVSGNLHHATSNNFESGDSVNSLIGKASNHDPTDEYFDDDDAENYTNGLSNFSYSFLINSDTVNTDKGFMVGITPTGVDNTSISARYDTAGFDSGFDDVIKFGISGSTGDGQGETTANSQTTNNQWIHVTWTSGTMTAYLNGTVETLVKNGEASGTTDGNDKMLIGRGSKDASDSWDGLIDEFRFRNDVLSADWIATEYNNQSATSTFYTIGAEETE